MTASQPVLRCALPLLLCGSKARHASLWLFRFQRRKPVMNIEGVLTRSSAPQHLNHFMESGGGIRTFRRRLMKRFVIYWNKAGIITPVSLSKNRWRSLRKSDKNHGNSGSRVDHHFGRRGCTAYREEPDWPSLSCRRRFVATS